MANLFEKILRSIAEGTVSVAAVVALLVALIGTIDVLTTRVLAQAIPGAFELSEAGLVLMVFLGMAIVTKEESHIKVDLLVNRMPRRLQLICAVFGLADGDGCRLCGIWCRFRFDHCQCNRVYPDCLPGNDSSGL
jgi:TRAP-type C4-dicarboxylate transport system permease small subunit